MGIVNGITGTKWERDESKAWKKLTYSQIFVLRAVVPPFLSRALRREGKRRAFSFLIFFFGFLFFFGRCARLLFISFLWGKETAGPADDLHLKILQLISKSMISIHNSWSPF